jgi:beta-glucosidase
MDIKDCGCCGEVSSGLPNLYVCPFIMDGSSNKTCVVGAANYTNCPGLKGTHLDNTLSETARLDYLSSKTTLDEKILQMTNAAPELYNLGIPEYNWLNDDQHGVARTTANATVFPNGVGLGATFDTDLIKQVGFVVGNEARGLHNGFLFSDPSGRSMGCNGCGMTMYAPNLNLVRDPRWGRAQEVYTEDPVLMKEMVINFVTGSQNNSIGSTYGPDGKTIQAGACCKHFAAYDIEGGAGTDDRYHFNAVVNGRDMWETYMQGFESCIKDAKAMHVMCSYNSLNGVPTCANGGLLNSILRDTWKWDGFVVSDYDAWANLFLTHKYAPDLETAAALGVNNGMDMEGGGNSVIRKMHDAVDSNKTNETEVDQAFRRLFRARIRLGMLDPPTAVSYNNIFYNSTQLATNKEHNAVNALAARKSMTMYKNKDGTLPLSSKTVSSLALLGFQASISGILSGNYARSANANNWGENVMQALVKRVGILNQEDGCSNIFCPEAQKSGGFDPATSAAEKSDVVVIMLGLAFDQYCSRAGSNFSSSQPNDYCEKETTDRERIELPENQKSLVMAVRNKVGPKKKIIAVLIHGGAIAFDDETLDALDGIIDAFYPGPHGAEAIAGVLFGDFSPAGRTPVTFYKSTASLPPLGHMKMYPNATDPNTYPGITYRFYTKEVLFPFGFGLSYTTFAYSNLHIVNGSTSFKPCDSIAISVDVMNTGAVDSDEVVQLYIKQPEATVPVPQVRLAAFTRVYIPAGQKKTVNLLVSPSSHAVVLADGGDATGEDIYTAWRSIAVEKGVFEMYAGGGQPDYWKGVQKIKVSIQSTMQLDQC